MPPKSEKPVNLLGMISKPKKKKKVRAVADPSIPKTKPKVSAKGRRQKGTLAENEVVAILERGGLPSMKIMGSGKWVKAPGDIKGGVPMDEDGDYPPPDEARCLFRAEVKNHATNPEALVLFIEGLPQIVFTAKDLMLPTKAFNALDQQAKVTVGFLRNPKPPKGVVKNLGSELYSVVMSMDSFMEMAKLAYENKYGKEITR